MPNRIMRAALLFATTVVFAGSPLSAQEKSSGKVLSYSTSSSAAKEALASALVEVTNFGGSTRVDARLKAVVDADPEFALGRAFYGGYVNDMTAADRARELEAALKAASGASAAEVTTILALREWRAGRTAVARDLLDAAIKQASDDPLLVWMRMNVAANAAEAVKIGEDAVKRFPTYAPIHNTYAYRLNATGRKDEAMLVVQKYIALAPDHPNPRDSYAELLQLNGRYDEANEHYKAALAIDPKWEAAHEGMAEVAVLRGNFAEARAHLTQSLAVATLPMRRLALQRQVVATHLFEGKIKEARTAMSKVIADAEAASINALPDKRAAALLAALDGKTQEATAQYAAALPPTPAPLFAVNDALFHAVLKHPAEVGKALASIEAHAARTPDGTESQDAMRAVRAINAAVNNDVATARAAVGGINAPVYKALGAAFVVQAAKRAGDNAAAQAAMADVTAYRTVTLTAGIVRLIATRK